MSNLYNEISPARRSLIIISVMTATLMQVLDTTIVNVALPHMQGSLSANPDEISWTLTSYLVSSAIFMPLTGYFSDRLGRTKYLLLCIGGFTVASAFCGTATTVSQIVLYRLLQGICGAGLVPLSQAILADLFPVNERGKAMAIWGTGVMIGPILGPTLGGYLTEVANWRWTFYVNVPVGIFAFLLAWNLVPDTAKKERSIDWIGLLLISAGIGGAQYFLDRGNQQDWFNALDIRLAAFISVIGLVGFVLYSIRPRARTVFDLSIFKDRNFAICSLLLGMFGLGLYGTMVIQPLMLENLLNYPVLTTGLVMAPRGMAGMVSMILVGKLIQRVDPRWLIATGVILSVIGTSVGTYYSQDITPAWVIAPILIQGFGLGMMFVPLSAVAFSTLPPQSRVEAAGLFSLLRTMGSSIGISVIITFFTRDAQMAWNQIGAFIQPYNGALQPYLQALHLTLSDPHASAVLGQELFKQSQMLAFVNSYAFITWSFICMFPLIFLLKKNGHTQAEPAAIVD